MSSTSPSPPSPPSPLPSPIRRPTQDQRPSSANSLSSSAKQNVHRTRRHHAVGANRAHTRNPSYGKAMGKAGKINSVQNLLKDENRHHRNNSSGSMPPTSPKTSLLKRNNSHVVLPKNLSHVSLRKNKSANALARNNLSHTQLHRKTGLGSALTKPRKGLPKSREASTWEISLLRKNWKKRQNGKIQQLNLLSSQGIIPWARRKLSHPLHLPYQHPRRQTSHVIMTQAPSHRRHHYATTDPLPTLELGNHPHLLSNLQIHPPISQTCITTRVHLAHLQQCPPSLPKPPATLFPAAALRSPTSTTQTPHPLIIPCSTPPTQAKVEALLHLPMALSVISSLRSPHPNQVTSECPLQAPTTTPLPPFSPTTTLKNPLLQSRAA